MKLINGAPPTFSYNQSAAAGSLASPGTLAYPSNVTIGNILIATWFTGNNTPPSPTISDSRSNTWTPCPGMPIITTSGAQCTWWAVANSSGACTVTFTSTGATPWVSVTEYTVTGTAAVLDKGASNSGSGTVVVTTAAAIGAADLLVIGVGSLPATVPTGWTARQNNSGFGFIADKLGTASGTQTVTVAGTGETEVGLLAFYSGPPTPPNNIGGS